MAPPTKENYVTRCLLTVGCESTNLFKDGTDEFAVSLVEVGSTIRASEDVLSLLRKILQKNMIWHFVSVTLVILVTFYSNSSAIFLTIPEALIKNPRKQILSYCMFEYFHNWSFVTVNIYKKRVMVCVEPSNYKYIGCMWLV